MPSQPRQLDQSNILSTLDLATVFIRELDGTIRFWSAGCRRLYGWTEDEAIGQSAHRLLDTVFPVPLEEIETALNTGREWQGDLGHRRRDGSRIIVEAHKVLRPDLAGGPSLVAESVTDVTELRRMAVELENVNASLARRVADEIRKREEALYRLAQSEKLNALNDLAGGLAHEFNNVLQAVSGLGSIIGRRAGDTDMVKRLAGLVDEAVERGAIVTRRLLSLTRRGDFKAEPVAIVEILNGLRYRFSRAGSGRIDVEVDAADDLPLLIVDRAQLEVALVNLAMNACDAMAEGGILRFEIRQERIEETDVQVDGLKSGEYVRINVSDNGAGMSPATLRRALEPFFTTKKRGEASGLGLPSVKAFVEQSGGALALSSDPGKGSVASIWLPVAAARERVVEKTPLLPRHNAGLPIVLVVDDEDLVRRVIADQLRDEGFEVLETNGGEAALSMLGTTPRVSLLISDLAMPGMTGSALIREAQRLRPGLPAMLLTGYAGDDTSDSIDAGKTYEILHKPISGTELIQRVGGMLAR